ncbi:beta-1,3-galactosyltransferase 1-like [Procambarus clarkii]|uniref:beta-1,3-galactosyltransferase 1-like n=1 Tax=Procambarus clarkii TaxID=6728 RepID=UPI00374350C0
MLESVEMNEETCWLLKALKETILNTSYRRLFYKLKVCKRELDKPIQRIPDQLGYDSYIMFLEAVSNKLIDQTTYQEAWSDQEPGLEPTPDKHKADSSPVGQLVDIPTQFLVEEAHYCQKRPNLQVIAYVHSAIINIQQRDDIRATWGNASAYDLGNISVQVGLVFMVGRVKSSWERHIVQEESQHYHDIVQGDYVDHYHHLSYKALASLYWINKHCSHVPWTLHADDDAHVDIFLFYRALQELDDYHRQRFVCYQIRSPVFRSGRWKVSYDEYPAEVYPRHCAGPVWFLQTKLIPRLLEASKVVPFLWVDDVYITGVLANNAGIKILTFNKYFDIRKNDPRSIGKKVVWFSQIIPSRFWWKKILSYHRKNSMHFEFPATIISKGEVTDLTV